MNVADAENGSNATVNGYHDREPGSSLPRHGISKERQTFHEKDNIQRRLKSFVSWVAASLPVQLAIAGFVYLGKGDEVKCETCHVRISGWKKEDVPLQRHRKDSPNCSFLQKWFPDTKQPTTSSSCETFNQRGYDTRKAKYQDYVEHDKRLASFNGWPLKNDIHSPTKMARAGFFYIGSADRAKCFNCGLTLRDWDATDDPLDSHLKYSPNCEYIQHIQEDKDKHDTNAGISQNSNQFTVTKASSTASTSPANKNVGEEMKSASMTSRKNHTSQVETVLAMGYPEHLIQTVIDKRLQTTGEDFPDAVSLYCAVEAMAEN